MKSFFLLSLLALFLIGCGESVSSGSDIPRLFIETENGKVVVDRSSYMPATFKVEQHGTVVEYNGKIRYRGNSSFTDMPKHSYKLELERPDVFLGLPADKDWALITNYADKSLIRNEIAYTLSNALGAPYTPRFVDVEVFLNGTYEGLYLLVETIKINPKRINLPKDESNFLVEFDSKFHREDQVITTRKSHILRVKNPKHASDSTLNSLENFIDEFETFLESEKLDSVEKWIDVEDYLRFYWIQEVAKNVDVFSSSTFFTWSKEGVIRMGPVWDFDVAFGVWPPKENAEGWFARNAHWNSRLFNDSQFVQRANDYWKLNYSIFESIVDSMDVFSSRLSIAAERNYKKWPVLQSTQNRFHGKSFNSYNEAVDTLKLWYKQRIEWINSQVNDCSR